MIRKVRLRVFLKRWKSDMRGGVIVLLLLFFGQNCVAQRGVLEEFIHSKALRHAAIGISVKRVADGKSVAEYNSSMALTPASLTKLITTCLAMKERGGEFKYKTSVFYDGILKDGYLDGNLIIEASGDPCLDSYYFPAYKFTEQLPALLKQAGIRKIGGAIRVESLLKEKEIPGSWVWEDISNYYGAQWHPFNYRDNIYMLEFRTGVPGSPAELVSVVPKLSTITFVNKVSASAQNGDNAWIFGGPYSREMHVGGTIPAHRASFKIKGAIHNPSEVFIEEVTRILVRHGVSVEHKESAPGHRTLLKEFYSPSLREIVYHTNKSSVNLFAEALGELVPNVREKLSILGIDASGVQLKDACGLSQQNAVPAQVFTDLLIWSDRNLGESFTTSLPIAGKDGNLNRYGKHPLLDNNLRAKTGSFGGVRCLSGYLKNSRGERLAFTIMVNHYSCETSELYTLMRTLLINLAQ